MFEAGVRVEQELSEHAEVPEAPPESRELTGGLRRRPRVDMRVPVRVSGAWTDSFDAFIPLLTRSVNVSEGGMTVVTPLLLQEGSSVMCSMRLDGEPVYLPGIVAWRRPAQRSELKTMGIEFTQACDADREPLRRALSRFSERHPLSLRFAGHDEAIRAYARTDGAQLCVSARLPFLRDGNEVEFSLGHESRRYRGRVSDVTVEHGGTAPGLEVWLTVDPEHRGQLRAQVEELEGRPLPDSALAPRLPTISRDAGHAMPPAEAASAVNPRPLPQARTLSLTRWQLVAVSLASLGFGAALASLEASDIASGHGTMAEKVSAVEAPPVQVVAGPFPQPQAVQALAAQSQTGAAEGPHMARPKRAGLPVPPAHPEPSATVQGISQVGSAPARPSHEASVVQPASAGEGFRVAPEISIHAGGRVVAIPMIEAGGTARHFRLASPPGIGIDVPDGKAALANAKYIMHRDDLLWLRVRQVDDTTRLRLFLKEPATDYAVQQDPEQIQVQLPPRARSAEPAPAADTR